MIEIEEIRGLQDQNDSVGEAHLDAIYLIYLDRDNE